MTSIQLNYHPEVEEALERDQPIVALESTLITHGFSAPKNLEVALAVETAVRDQGVVPATIAILGGSIHVGLSHNQLELLANSNNVRKCSVRDLPLAVAGAENGATTVAATMVIARWAGIRIFATGGIGGVHHGDDQDISTDLMELGRIPVTVVCAGIKGFLNLPASLEYLETQAVPILGYKTKEFPAFFSRGSGLPIDLNAETPEVVAAVIEARDALQLTNAIVLGVPVPEHDEWPLNEAQIVIQQALQEATNQGIKGKDITPFMLSRIAELSEGQSLKANIALLLNNAKVAAQVARALCRC